MSLGPLGTIGLADARDLTAEARKLVRSGQDPVAERQAAKAAAAASAATTFEEVAKEWMESRAEKWAPTYARKVEEVLRATQDTEDI